MVPMDGFHLAQAELERLGRAGRKGAPDTFDASGFVARMERLVARHRAFGRTADAAQAFAYGSDQANAEVIAATRGRADVVVAG